MAVRKGAVSRYRMLFGNSLRFENSLRFRNGLRHPGVWVKGLEVPPESNNLYGAFCKFGNFAYLSSSVSALVVLMSSAYIA